MFPGLVDVIMVRGVKMRVNKGRVGMPFITMHVLQRRKNKSDDERQTALDRQGTPHEK